jgi:hypothetical protein
MVPQQVFLESVVAALQMIPAPHFGFSNFSWIFVVLNGRCHVGGGAAPALTLLGESFWAPQNVVEKYSRISGHSDLNLQLGLDY